jgi:DNA-binding MarR family transcriptional regulator
MNLARRAAIDSAIESWPGEDAAVDDEDAVVHEVLVDEVLTASRSLMAVALHSLGATAQDTTIAQCRALTVLVNRGPQRVVDLAGALGVAPSTAGRMCDRLLRKGLIRRRHARGDRRAVLVSVTADGRQVVDEAMARHRTLIADILRRLPGSTADDVARLLREFADAAAEVPGGRRADGMQAGVRTGAEDVPEPRSPERPAEEA